MSIRMPLATIPILAWVVALSLASVGPVAAAETPPAAEASDLRLVSDPWPPFTGEEGQGRVAIALVHEALQRIGHSAETEIVPSGFARVVERIEAGEFDGSAAMWRTPAREKTLLFSVPYLENRLVLVGRADGAIEARSIADLAGKRVGVVEAYAYGELLAQVPGPMLVKGESDQANLRRLVEGEVDYVLADELLVHHLFGRETEQDGRRLRAGRFPLVTRTLHLAIRRDHPGGAELIERFDAEIRAMMKDGSYNRILELDWIWVDIDGDGTAELVLGGVQAGSSAPSPEAYDVLSGPDEIPDGQKDSRYVVDGKVYKEWEHVPDRYKVPIDRTREPVEPVIPVIRF